MDELNALESRLTGVLDALIQSKTYVQGLPPDIASKYKVKSQSDLHALYINTLRQYIDERIKVAIEAAMNS